MEQIREAGKKVAVITMKSANMSLGVNMLLKLLKEAARTLARQALISRSSRSITTAKVDATERNTAPGWQTA